MISPRRRNFRETALTAVRDPGKSAEVTDKFLWDVHKYTNDYIRFADTKAAFVAAASTALIGTLVGSSVLDSCFRINVFSWPATKWVGFIGLLFLSASLCLSVNAIRPRLWNSTSAGYIFWESVAGHGTAQAFSHAVGDLTATERTTATSDHLFQLAIIAKRKYEFVKLAIYSGMPGGVLAGIALFMRHALASPH
jgi:hypothetical protein